MHYPCFSLFGPPDLEIFALLVTSNSQISRVLTSLKWFDGPEIPPIEIDENMESDNDNYADDDSDYD